jgi:trimeric autotransporter adhesin
MAVRKAKYCPVLFEELIVAHSVKKSDALYSALALLPLAQMPMANAQEAAPEPVALDPLPQVSQAAIDLVVRPRGTVGYQTNESGNEGFSYLEGFFPLWQTPGQSVMFLQGNVRLSNSDFVGGNLLLGYRQINLDQQSLWGGYIGLDTQGTESEVLTQLGAGLEYLGDWDMRANVYLPLSDGDGLGLSGTPYFQENLLLFPVGGTTALTSADVEVGLPIAQLSNGPVRAFGGLYYYGGDDVDGTLGVRARLEAQPLDALKMGLGVQYDELFGTTVTLGVNVRLDGHATPERGIMDRANNSVRRSMGIATISVPETVIAAINPDTGETWHFWHVDAGAGGDTTFESPTNDLNPAFDAHVASGDINSVVYVRDLGTYNNANVPDGVLLLSTGPEQLLNTQFGELLLPMSGSGDFPNLVNTVDMARNTVLSGFIIDGVESDGIRSIDAFNIEIRDNIINNVHDGISFANADGEITIIRNQIVTATTDSLGNAIGDSGIDIINFASGTNAVVTIADNDIFANDDGIHFSQIGGDAQVTVAVTNNSIEANDTGVYFDDIYDNAVVDITVTDNAISILNDEGFEIDSISDSANVNLTVVRNNISSTNNQGVYFQVIEDDAVVNMSIFDNTIEAGAIAVNLGQVQDNAQVSASITNNVLQGDNEGVRLASTVNNANTIATVSGNTITSENAGIYIDHAQDMAEVDITITDNIITSNVGDGIHLDDISHDANVRVNIAQNRITARRDGTHADAIGGNANVSLEIDGNDINATEMGIYLNNNDNATTDVTITDNAINANNIDGVQINQNSTSDLCVELANNNASAPTGDGYELNNSGAGGDFEIANQAQVTAQNTGSFNPSDVSANPAYVSVPSCN